MIEHVVERLGRQGVTRAVLSLGYRPDVFETAYPQRLCAGVELVYAVEPEPLDTAGAIAFAARQAGVEDPFIAVNGDVISDFPLADLWAEHQQTGAEATIGLTPVEDPSRYGVVVSNPDGRVQEFVEKPPAGEIPSRWINAGVYALSRAVLDLIPEGRRVSIERETFPSLVERGTLFSVARDRFWVDVGTPAAYRQAQLALSGGGHIHPQAKVSSQAQVEGSVIMEEAVVSPGAQVSGSVLLPGSTVEQGAVVDNSIVGCGAKIGEGAWVSDLCVVGDDYSVPPRAELIAKKMPEST